MRNPSNILRHELVGLYCKVIRADNKSQVGIHGKIADETMKMLVINDKRIPKRGTTFRVRLGTKSVDIDGNYIIARPEDRIKKKIRKW